MGLRSRLVPVWICRQIFGHAKLWLWWNDCVQVRFWTTKDSLWDYSTVEHPNRVRSEEGKWSCHCFRSVCVYVCVQVCASVSVKTLKNWFVCFWPSAFAIEATTEEKRWVCRLDLLEVIVFVSGWTVKVQTSLQVGTTSCSFSLQNKVHSWDTDCCIAGKCQRDELLMGKVQMMP